MFRKITVVWTLALLLAAACRGFADEEEHATDKPAEMTPAVEADRFAVPDGTPQELIEYVQQLISIPPQDEETVKKTRKAILQAAEKILAGKANDKEMQIAVQLKMNMLESPEELTAFEAELKQGGHNQLARQVRAFMLQIELVQSRFGGPEAAKKAIVGITDFFKETPPQAEEVNLAIMAGRLAEMLDDNKFAIDTYQSLIASFAASKDPRIVAFADMLKGVVRRLNLVGQAMTIEGKLPDGSKFDWSKYEGKIVLVDFWATWCDPCLEEIPLLLECYELYRDKGFDILGISLDRTPADLENFVKEKKIPWPTIYGDDKPSPTVTYYGVYNIPNMILVGKDGKVLALNVTGKNLQGQLTELLGPAEKKTLKVGEE